MTPTEKVAHCSKSAWSSGSFQSYPCSRKATVSEEGKGWCWQHAPWRGFAYSRLEKALVGAVLAVDDWTLPLSVREARRALEKG